VFVIIFVWGGGGVELFLCVIVRSVGVVCSPSKIVEVLGTCRRVNRTIMTPHGNAAEAAYCMRRVAHGTPSPMCSRPSVTSGGNSIFQRWFPFHQIHAGNIYITVFQCRCTCPLLFSEVVTFNANVFSDTRLHKSCQNPASACFSYCNHRQPRHDCLLRSPVHISSYCHRSIQL
jgi:hypothetical protein